MPLGGNRSMHLLRAESPGPEVGKLAPKMRSTAMILYGIYIILTALQTAGLTVGEEGDVALLLANRDGHSVLHALIAD